MNTPRPVKRSTHLTLAEWRAKLECEADPVGAPMRRAAGLALLRYAVGRAISCRAASCGRVLDVSRAVHVSTTTGGGTTLCASCYDARREEILRRLEPFGAEVYDGRELNDGASRMLGGMLR
jgi:hypothetical protein